MDTKVERAVHMLAGHETLPECSPLLRAHATEEQAAADQRLAASMTLRGRVVEVVRPPYDASHLPDSSEVL